MHAIIPTNHKRIISRNHDTHEKKISKKHTLNTQINSLIYGNKVKQMNKLNG